MYNWLPNKDSVLTPLEILFRSKYDYCDLLRCHVWVFPVFVLDPKLHNDQKLLKWNRRARLGQFIGFLGEHSFIVSNVRHLSTRYIYPQFHFLFDDLFEAVIHQVDYDSTVEAICSDFFILI